MRSGPGPGRLRLVLATANPDKAAEIRAIFEQACGGRIELEPRGNEVPDVEETGETLEENALLKAVALSAARGLPALADDSGLEVEALGGAPGVRTARYSGDKATYASNVRKLLDELGDARARQARFRTVAALVWPDGTSLTAEGVVDGRISESARGARGFGYDPVFEPDDGAGRTFAEMGDGAKNEISHRGRAFRALAERLGAEMGWT